jgi:transcriptional regulator with XRE-family HTH domain
MKNRVGQFFRAKRLKQGISVEALAVRLGYRNIRKGTHRLLRFEQDGRCSDEFLVRLTDALGVSAHVVLDLLTRDPGPWPEGAFWSDRLVAGEFCRATASHGVHHRDRAEVGQGQAESGRKP